MTQPSSFRRFVRRVWPWVVGTLILLFLVRKMPLSAFREATSSGPHLELIVVEVVMALVVLVTDALAAWAALRATSVVRPFLQITAVRGASFVLFLVNYALGQSAFGYYLHRTGLATKRSVGVTLFLVGINLATMLVLTTIAWSVGGGDFHSRLGLTLLIGVGGYLIYLALIAIRPRALAVREVLTPLFEAKIRGHVLAMLGRIPHSAAMTLGVWVAIRVWGIDAPFVSAVTVMPIVVIITALPIAPAGLGTTNAALVYFFSQYAQGATADAQRAHVFAFSIVHFVYMVGTTLLVGLVCIPYARRTTRQHSLLARAE